MSRRARRRALVSGVQRLLRRDEHKSHVFSFAKKAAAFFNISRSICNRLFSRRSRISSSRSAVVNAPGGPLPASTSTLHPFTQCALGQIQIPGDLPDTAVADLAERTASTLNSNVLNFLRIRPMVELLPHSRAIFDVHANGGGSRGAPRRLGRDPKWLGAELGITSVLHTWTRDLRFHPHVRCIVTGGGLALDGERWISTRPGFLLPVRVLGCSSRKFLARLVRLRGRRAPAQGSASALADPRAVRACATSSIAPDGSSTQSNPSADPRQVFRYLGQYTHRVGLSNRRLVSLDERGVRFRTRGDGTVALAPEGSSGASSFTSCLRAS